VTLVASPEPGSVFAGWSGAGCSGTGACTVKLTGNASVTARFDPAPAAGQASTPTSPGAVSSNGQKACADNAHKAFQKAAKAARKRTGKARAKALKAARKQKAKRLAHCGS
jgi:hypothetical protein